MKLPFQPPLEPMLSLLSERWPETSDWLYEPKWDGFRTLVFWDGEELYLQSRDSKPMNRYFPELEAGLKAVLPGPLVLDGEVVIAGPDGLDFEGLLLRIHPAASRVAKLAAETPASFVAFDLLAVGEEDLREQPQAERRRRLEELQPRPPWSITPCTRDRNVARDWFTRFEGAGLDGVIAKPQELPYRPKERAMVKLKHRRTADCVVGGFRWAKDKVGKAVGSLLLGLYDKEGQLHHVGHTSSFKAREREELVALLEPHRGESFGQGRTPGSPSRWSAGKDLSWESLSPTLVCEVSYDHMQGDRFRHAATFVRWRDDKPPRECDYAQLETVVPAELKQLWRSQ